MKNKYHTYLVVYMAEQDGGTIYGNGTFATESTGHLLFLDAQHHAMSCCHVDSVVVLNICKLD